MESISPLARDLKKHITENHIMVDMDDLLDWTCIPDNVKELVMIYSGVWSGENSDCEETFPERKKQLMLDVIESFIRDNDFDTKDDWSNAIIEEYLMIQDSGIFPKSVLEAFEDASATLQVELQLKDILELKKIICSPPDYEKLNRENRDDIGDTDDIDDDIDVDIDDSDEE